MGFCCCCWYYHNNDCHGHTHLISFPSLNCVCWCELLIIHFIEFLYFIASYICHSFIYRAFSWHHLHNVHLVFIAANVFILFKNWNLLCKLLVNILYAKLSMLCFAMLMLKAKINFYQYSYNYINLQTYTFKNPFMTLYFYVRCFPFSLNSVCLYVYRNNSDLFN